MGRSLRSSSGRGNHVTALLLCVGGSSQRDSAAAWPLECCPGRSCLPALALHFLPICHWCPSSCCHVAESQSGWVCVSPKSIAGHLRGVFWEPHNFFCCSNPTGFYSQKLWELMFLVLKPWARWSGLGLGSFAPRVSLPFFNYHMWIWDHPFLSAYLSIPLCFSAPPTHLD